jgi:hypothetical protein
MTANLAVRDETVIEAVRPSSGLALSFGEMAMRVRQLDEFYRDVMQEGTDYGVIPGTNKPSLYQPGAQLLDQIFGLVPMFEVDTSSLIDWQRPIPFFHYVIRCKLMSRRGGELVAEAIGSCNTHEDRYRWRTAKRSCPDCKAETIIKGKQEFGGGWLCFKKNGGCGAKFRDGEAIIEDQVVGRAENEDAASLENTVLKMAQKRAHVAATLNATGASRIFTQDVEDMPEFAGRVVASESRPAPQQAAPVQIVNGTVSDAPAGSGPASVEFRAKFEKNWQRGWQAAVKCGAALPDKPGEEASEADLDKALREFSGEVVARQKLNTELTARTARVRELGGDVADLEPASMTTVEVFAVLEALDAMIAAGQAEQDVEAAETANDDTEAPF